jgi:hypothetical protein
MRLRPFLPRDRGRPMKRLLFILGFALFVFKSSAQDFRVQIAAYADSMPAAYFKARGVVHYITTSDQMGLYRTWSHVAFHTPM